ncbi:MAG: cation-translocating P-type ATPase [Desulfuromonadales bacterium]|nr:cation-translocating P-type ATPase [Desulfuromonadales bacterium]
MPNVAHKEPYQMTIDALFQAQSTTTRGLTTAQAAERLARLGRNELREAQRRSPWQMLLDQYRDPMIVLLLAAALVSGLIGGVKDAIVILIIVLLNSIIGFIQEYRAEKSLAALKRLAAPFAMVRREGEVQKIPAAELVPGDLLLFDAGTIIPADVRLTDSSSLKVNEASLTGESVSVEKIVGPLEPSGLPLGDRCNMAFRGTQVSYGHGCGVVTATGMATEMGKIAHLLDTTATTRTPLQNRLARVGRNLALATLLICSVVFFAGLLRGEELMLMFLTAVSLAVAAVPEALPAVVTICLALGARQLVAQNSLIRQLSAVETLGSTTCICSDKTGTLTLNQMTVEQLYDVDDRPVFRNAELTGPQQQLLLALALNNDVELDTAGQPVGDPTEIALWEEAQRFGFGKQQLLKDYPRVAEIPFSSERQAMSTIHHTRDGRLLLLCKGSFEAVSAGCLEFDRQSLVERTDALARKGLRVLAFACRELATLPGQVDDQLETDLQFLGLSGSLDPPRDETADAVRECQRAGITPVMITGDHPLTAVQIAVRIGLVESAAARVVSGPELSNLTEQELVALAGEVRVYARVAPEQKLKIVSALQQRGEAVAMTGDGVNDAPALKKAEIGIAMGITGTDVAKEAAGMVLLDDNFATIIRAVREGRKIYDNIRKFFRYTLTSNAGEIWTIFLAPFFGLPIPLLPIHILWINLLTDGAPGLALTTEPAEKNVMRRPPLPPDEGLFARGMWQQILWIGLLMGGVCLLTQAIAIERGWHWQTMVFTVLCVSQLFNSLAIRSERESLFSRGLTSNLPLLVTVLLSIALQLGIVYLPALQSIFHTQALALNELLFCFVMSTLVFIAVEFEKLLLRRGWLRYR